MQRFFIEGPLREGEVQLPEHTARQVTTVLRMQAGERLVLFDGAGWEWVGELMRTGRGARVRLVERREGRKSPRRRVTLCQALLKGERMEWVLQKGTELGVAAFQPLLTERVVARKTDVPERWRRIVVEAAEQCGRTDVPFLRDPASLDDALAAPGQHVFCWEGGPAATLWSYLSAAPSPELALHVGPEGGFSDKEALSARARGAAIVSLGDLILRAETAGIAASALAVLAP